MMRKQWIGVCAVIAAAALLIPTTPLFAPKTVKKTPQSTSFSVKREHTLKLAAVKADMNATAMLCVTECSKDFRQLMADSGNQPEHAGAKMQQMMKEHMHMKFVSWMSGKRHVDRGELPKTADNHVKGLVEQPERRLPREPVMNRRPLMRLMAAGIWYLACLIRRMRIGVVGVIKQDIVKAVEKHQMRNLRLVPYPAEGNYKIESVKPNDGGHYGAHR